MTTQPRLTQLSQAGVSIWLDDLSRERIGSGSLERLINESGVVGVTTNPTIFAGALSNGESYADQVRVLAAEGMPVQDAVFAITTDDVRAACDIFRPLYERTNGVNGRVSIEVEPTLAHDAAGTIAQAKRLWATVDRPNAMIKIPATVAGLSAITAATAAGISVNVTLIFSLERYRQVVDAYLSGLEQALAAGLELASIHSVASFFISRVDTEIDRRLAAVGTEDARALTGKAGVANARLAYRLFVEEFESERASGLRARGATVQRPLWASTGVKDPAVPDTLYVSSLVAPNVVNTMPEKTLLAFADHGDSPIDTVTGSYAGAEAVLAAISGQGISYDDVTLLLEEEGVSKFVVSWNELLDTVTAALASARLLA